MVVEEEFHLVDFKTGRLPAGAPAMLSELTR
jgi:hypothetical protein